MSFKRCSGSGIYNSKNVYFVYYKFNLFIRLFIYLKINYFAWLEQQLSAGNVLNEIDGANRLEKFRGYDYINTNALY
jgi:hypothetical protein